MKSLRDGYPLSCRGARSGPRALRNTGFTLLEVVFSIAILAIIASMTYGSLQQIMLSKKVLDDGRDARFIANSLLNRVTRELQLANDQNRLLPDSAGSNLTALRPDRLIGRKVDLPNGRRGDQITFLALEAGQYLPDGGRHSGQVQISYRVEPDPDVKSGEPARYMLIREETPHTTPYDKALQRTVAFPITRDLVSFRLEYFSPRADQWLEEWDAQVPDRLPSLIRFSIRLRSPLGREVLYVSQVATRGE